MEYIEYWTEQLNNLNARFNIIQELLSGSMYNETQIFALESEGKRIIKQINEINNSIFVESQIQKYLEMSEKVNESSNTLH